MGLVPEERSEEEEGVVGSIPSKAWSYTTGNANNEKTALPNVGPQKAWATPDTSKILIPTHGQTVNSRSEWYGP